MCRLTVYKGKGILLGDLVVRPENSLVCQSRDAAFHPGVVDKTHERNIRVNGDGFGVAFYGNEPSSGACVFKFVTPAWSNANLLNLGDYVTSNLIMAHVRAASSGLDPKEKQYVSTDNCHPFKYGRWTFMHNGAIPRFSRIKLPLLNLLSFDCFQGIVGNTDSEHIFALFLTFLCDRDAPATIEEFSFAVQQTIFVILQLLVNADISDPCSLNMVFTDGVNIIATRFRNGLDSPPSLYYNFGKDFNFIDGRFRSVDEATACEIVVSSAPLSKDCEVDSNGYCDSWNLMPENHMLICVGHATDYSKVSSVYIQKIEIPIIEKVTNISTRSNPFKADACCSSKMSLTEHKRRCSYPKRKTTSIGVNTDLTVDESTSMVGDDSSQPAQSIKCHCPRCGFEFQSLPSLIISNFSNAFNFPPRVLDIIISITAILLIFGAYKFHV